MVRSLAGYDAPFGFAAMGVAFGPLAAAMPIISGVVGVGSTLAGMAGTSASMKATRQSMAINAEASKWAQAGAIREGEAAMEAADANPLTGWPAVPIRHLQVCCCCCHCR